MSSRSGLGTRSECRRSASSASGSSAACLSSRSASSTEGDEENARGGGSRRRRSTGSSSSHQGEEEGKRRRESGGKSVPHAVPCQYLSVEPPELLFELRGCSLTAPSTLGDSSGSSLSSSSNNKSSLFRPPPVSPLATPFTDSSTGSSASVGGADALEKEGREGEGEGEEASAVAEYPPTVYAPFQLPNSGDGEAAGTQRLILRNCSENVSLKWSVVTNAAQQFTVKQPDRRRLLAPGETAVVLISIKKSVKQLRTQTRFLVQYSSTTSNSGGNNNTGSSPVLGEEYSSPKDNAHHQRRKGESWRGRNFDMLQHMTVQVPCSIVPYVNKQRVLEKQVVQANRSIRTIRREVDEERRKLILLRRDRDLLIEGHESLMEDIERLHEEVNKERASWTATTTSSASTSSSFSIFSQQFASDDAGKVRFVDGKPVVVKIHYMHLFAFTLLLLSTSILAFNLPTIRVEPYRRPMAEYYTDP